MNRHTTHIRRKRESGAILLVAALGLTVLLLFAGLAVDSGLMQLKSLQLQTAADAAAIGAARELARGNEKGMDAAARDDAALNGCRDGSSIVLNYPPQHGRYLGDRTAVEVIASHTNSTLLMALAGSKSTRLTARAVGRLASNGQAVILGE